MPEIDETFLAELSALCTKYQLYINGCGCCGSPFLSVPNKPANIEHSACGTSIEVLLFDKETGEVFDDY